MAGCKVCRVLAAYDLERYDDRLVSQWTAPKGERKGYRELADWLNTALLRRRMDRAGLPTLGGEAESKYERLQSDEAVARGLRDQLRSEGIDVEALMDDFVSYGVVRTHLLECLGAEREQQATDWEMDALETTEWHAKSKAEEAVRSLMNKGGLVAPEGHSIQVEITVECDSCRTRVPVRRAARRGWVCDCSRSLDEQA